MNQLGLFDPVGAAGTYRLFMVGKHGRQWHGTFDTEADAKREARRLRRDYLAWATWKIEAWSLPS